MTIYVVGYTGWTNSLKLFYSESDAEAYVVFLKNKYSIIGDGLGKGIDYVFIKREIVN